MSNHNSNLLNSAENTVTYETGEEELSRETEWIRVQQGNKKHEEDNKNPTYLWKAQLAPPKRSKEKRCLIARKASI